jgi:hypothetical protein
MLNKKIGLITLLAGVAASSTWAGTLTNFAVGDVLVCFRLGGNDMVVNAGPISTFTSGASPNQRIPINQYNSTQIGDIGLNSVTWSAFAWQSDNTVFVTKARPSYVLNQQTGPLSDQSGSSQAGIAGRMSTIPPGALDSYTLGVNPDSTPTAVIEDDFSDGNPNYPTGVSYHQALAGAYGSDFDGKLLGNPENTTTNRFVTTKGSVSRSDLYQLTSTLNLGVAATYLGYFELTNNGTMTFVAKPTATPVISGITYSGGTATITYSTGIYGTYTLLGSYDISAPLNSWTVIGGSLSSGDNLSHTVQDTDSAPNKFYIIQGQ